MKIPTTPWMSIPGVFLSITCVSILISFPISTDSFAMENAAMKQAKKQKTPSQAAELQIEKQDQKRQNKGEKQKPKASKKPSDDPNGPFLKACFLTIQKANRKFRSLTERDEITPILVKKTGLTAPTIKSRLNKWKEGLPANLEQVEPEALDDDLKEKLEEFARSKSAPKVTKKGQKRKEPAIVASQSKEKKKAKPLKKVNQEVPEDQGAFEDQEVTEFEPVVKQEPPDLDSNLLSHLGQEDRANEDSFSSDEDEEVTFTHAVIQTTQKKDVVWDDRVTEDKVEIFDHLLPKEKDGKQQKGLRAVSTIKAGHVIAVYKGKFYKPDAFKKKFTKDSLTDLRERYIANLDIYLPSGKKKKKGYIDAYNEDDSQAICAAARVNHTSKKHANAELLVSSDSSNTLLLVAKKNIHPGEEKSILMDVLRKDNSSRRALENKGEL